MNDCDINGDSGDVDAICVNSDGSHECQCPVGYAGTGTVGTNAAGEGCDDVDECLVRG